MQFSVEDGAAIAFNRGFYGSLAKGQPLEVAMVNGRLAMCEHSDSADWLAPMLFMRALDGYLFKPDKPALPAPPSARGRQGEAALAERADGADVRNGNDNGGLSFRPLAHTYPAKSGSPTRPLAFLAPPLPPYKLVGRDNILLDLKEQLFAGALAFSALNGLPGVGKTALAVALTHDPEVQAHFKDGVLWAGLGRTPDVLALLGNWALALGFTSDEIAKRTTIEERQRLLSTAIGRRQMLLVVDDAWKSEAALAFKVGGPNCAHLVTTRQPSIALDFAGKKGLTKVTELSLSDGLVLLETLAPQAVAEEADIARQLVEAVGGLPLAIILMGRYLEKETYDDQPHRLSEALAELRDVEERLILEQPQESLERYPALPAGVPLSLLAVIEMSDKALDEVARRAFYALSVLPPKPNTFSVEAAQAVSQASTKALNKLIDYGLMESGRSGRYTLHQAIADYAKALLTDTNAYERMVTFFVNYVEAHEREYDALGTEKNNVYAALEAAYARDMQTALVQGTNAFYRFMEVKGLYGLADTYLERAEQTARTLDDSIALVTTLLNLGRIAEKQGNYPQAEEYLQEGLVLARKLEHGERISALLTALGAVAGGRGAYDQAKAYYQEGLALAQADESSERISLLLANLGVLESDRGAYDEADAYYQKGLALALELGNRERICNLLANLGDLAAQRGAYAQAEAYLQKGLKLAQALGSRTRMSHLLVNLGEVARNRGAYDQAEEYFQEGLALARALGHRWLMSAALVERGKLHTGQHSWDLAAATFREALKIAQGAGIQQFVASAWYGLAQVAFAQGKYASARQQGQGSLTIFEEIGHGDADKVEEWLAGLPTEDSAK
jgi:tetratricopeptide (TPR) repeat protein